VLKDTNRHDELRAGAAWALGQFASATSATALVDTFDSSPLEIKVEAARALLRIADPQITHLLDLLKTSNPARRDGIAWALARTGKFNPAGLVASADDNLRKWTSYIVGYGKDHFVQADIEAICRADPEVYFAASVLWQILASWVSDLKEY
jgi:HEAT repeat protein